MPKNQTLPKGSAASLSGTTSLAPAAAALDRASTSQHQQDVVN